MRALLTNHGFTISVFVAVTAVFAFVLEAGGYLASLGRFDRNRRTRRSFDFGAPARDRHDMFQRGSESENDRTEDLQEICR